MSSAPSPPEVQPDLPQGEIVNFYDRQVNFEQAEGMSLYALCRLWVQNDPDYVLDDPLPPAVSFAPTIPLAPAETASDESDGEPLPQPHHQADKQPATQAEHQQTDADKLQAERKPNAAQHDSQAIPKSEPGSGPNQQTDKQMDGQSDRTQEVAEEGAPEPMDTEEGHKTPTAKTPPNPKTTPRQTHGSNSQAGHPNPSLENRHGEEVLGDQQQRGNVGMQGEYSGSGYGNGNESGERSENEGADYRDLPALEGLLDGHVDRWRAIRKRKLARIERKSLRYQKRLEATLAVEAEHARIQHQHAAIAAAQQAAQQAVMAAAQQAAQQAQHNAQQVALRNAQSTAQAATSLLMPLTGGAIAFTPSLVMAPGSTGPPPGMRLPSTMGMGGGLGGPQGPSVVVGNTMASAQQMANAMKSAGSMGGPGGPPHSMVFLSGTPGSTGSTAVGPRPLLFGGYPNMAARPLVGPQPLPAAFAGGMRPMLRPMGPGGAWPPVTGPAGAPAGAPPQTLAPGARLVPSYAQGPLGAPGRPVMMTTNGQVVSTIGATVPYNPNTSGPQMEPKGPLAAMGAPVSGFPRPPGMVVFPPGVSPVISPGSMSPPVGATPQMFMVGALPRGGAQGGPPAGVGGLSPGEGNAAAQGDE